MQISSDAAIRRALERLEGGSLESVKLDTKDGKLVWIIRFTQPGDLRKEVWIDANTEEVTRIRNPDGTICEGWAYIGGKCICGKCPMLVPPGPGFCPDGNIVPGGIDSCGCQQAPKCEQVFCTADAKTCDDGNAVGRVPPSCEFAPCPDNQEPSELERTFCTPSDKQADVCTREFHPVCGWFGDNVQCIRYPCVITQSNPCEACKNLDVEYWTEGECPAN